MFYGQSPVEFWAFFFCRFGDAKKFQAELDSATHRVQVRLEMLMKFINVKDTYVEDDKDIQN